MHPSLTTNYLLPAILLNPILFLHSINTIVSRLLPPVVASSATLNPIAIPYTPLGPSPSHPHLDVHASDSLCWSYTVLMVCAQLVAFGRVSSTRQERKDRKAAREERLRSKMRGNGTWVRPVKQEDGYFDDAGANGDAETPRAEAFGTKARMNGAVHGAEDEDEDGDGDGEVEESSGNSTSTGETEDETIL
jgi:hypothetical protein